MMLKKNISATLLPLSQFIIVGKFIVKERLLQLLDKERIEIIYKDGSSLHTCLPDFTQEQCIEE